MMPTMRYWLFLVIALAAVGLAGCNTQGVNSFAADGSAMTLLQGNGLYVLDANGEQRVYLGVVSDVRSAAVLSNDGQMLFYVDRFNNRLQAVPSDASRPPVRITSESASGESTLLAVLPNNHLFFLDERGNTNRYFVQVIDPITTEVLQQIEAIENAYINAGAIRPQVDSATSEWLLAPITMPDQVQLVFQAQGLLFHYTIRDTLEFVATLPRQISAADAALLAQRVPNNVGSALITEDARYLVLRTRQGISPNFIYGLYAISLIDNSPPVELVAGVRELPSFALAPNGQQVVYEVPGTPRTMIAYTFDSQDFTPLDVGSFDPSWWR